MKQLGLLGCLATLVLASACNKTETVESEDIRTSGIYPEFTVLAEGNGKSVASATFKVGGNDSNTTLDLTGKDEVICSAAGTDKTLSGSGTEYKATFSTDEAGTEFVFNFERGTADENAPDSHVALPAPFELTGVASGDEISRADDSLTVTWTASDSADDTHSWSLTGDCLYDTTSTVSKDGTATLSGKDFDGDAFADDPKESSDKRNCKATLCVDRKLVGKLDVAFSSEEGGEIRAIQRRCISFISIP